MFKAHVEHLVISIFPLLAFPDPPWAKHYKDTPSTVQTSGIFGWLNKHEKQMGQDRNRYILVLDLTYIYYRVKSKMFVWVFGKKNQMIIFDFGKSSSLDTV